MSGYGNDPARWPKTWNAFVILAPKLGIYIDKPKAFPHGQALIAWNWFLEGMRAGKDHESIHQLRVEVEGQ
jgi:hypothetical protein